MIHLSLSNPLLRILRKFLETERGSVALIFGIVSIPLFMLVAGTVEYSRAASVRTKIQGALDNAVIAATKVADDNADIQASAEAFVKANLTGAGIDPDIVNVNVNVVEDSLNTRKIEITASAELPNLFGDLFGRSTVTISTAATAEQQRSNIEISLVLDISSSMAFRNRLRNLQAAAKEFLDIMFVTETDKDLVRINLVPYGGTVRTKKKFAERFLKPGISPLPRNNRCFDYVDTTTNDVGELITDIMDDELIPDEYYDPVPDFYKWFEGNPWCPPFESRIFVLQNDKDRLKLAIDELRLSDGTGTDIGAAWGLKLLSEKWQDEIPATPTYSNGKPLRYSNEDVVKVLVIMTDGWITGQFRPAPGAPEGRDIDEVGQVVLYDKNHAIRNFRNVCDTAKATGAIRVYTIGFEVPYEDMLELLQECASSPSHYFETSRTSITEVFSKIATELKPLQLTN